MLRESLKNSTTGTKWKDQEYESGDFYEHDVLHRPPFSACVFVRFTHDLSLAQTQINRTHAAHNSNEAVGDGALRCCPFRPCVAASTSLLRSWTISHRSNRTNGKGASNSSLCMKPCTTFVCATHPDSLRQSQSRPGCIRSRRDAGSLPCPFGREKIETPSTPTCPVLSWIVDGAYKLVGVSRCAGS